MVPIGAVQENGISSANLTGLRLFGFDAAGSFLVFDARPRSTMSVQQEVANYHWTRGSEIQWSNSNRRTICPSSSINVPWRERSLVNSVTERRAVSPRICRKAN